MHITIEINTQDANPEDKAVLAAISGVPVATVEATPAPAPKAAPAAKKATPAPKAEKVAEPEPEEAEENLVDGDDESGPTLQDAKDLATKLVSEGKAKKVKEVLTDLGAKRVSELEEGDIAAFVAALS